MPRSAAENIPEVVKYCSLLTSSDSCHLFCFIINHHHHFYLFRNTYAIHIANHNTYMFMNRTARWKTTHTAVLLTTCEHDFNVLSQFDIAN